MLTLPSSSSSPFVLLCSHLFLLSLLLASAISISPSSTFDSTTPVLTTPVPTTHVPTTAHPITADPATADPTTADPATADPTTADPTTPESRREGGRGGEPKHVESDGEGRGDKPDHVQSREQGRNKTEQIQSKKGGMKIVKHFYLWTRKNSGNSSSQLLDPTRPDTISDSRFRPGKTFVIIHGFLGWGVEPWILHFKDKLLGVSARNVVSVDWPAGTSWWLPSYYTAVSRVPRVAKDLSSLLHSLATIWDLDFRDVHLIGHSLGAHVAGLAAAPIDTVGRISGLDPAGLMYHKVPDNQCLDQSDADYVDVIHTNGCTTFDKWLDCYGINENLGHSDFWPNGGQHQPSCGKKKKKMANGEIGCSHEMAYVYYMESLDYNVDQTYYLARGCGSWDDYKAGRCACGRETQYMGFSVNTRLNGTFYLTTNSSPPYAAKDDGCPPGSATAPGLRIIKLVLVTAVGLIVTGATLSAIITTAAKRRSAATLVCGEEDGAVASGSSVGSDDVTVEVEDKKVLLD